MAAGRTLITVAPTGAEADKAAVPALPVTLAELVLTAKECEAAGAAPPTWPGWPSAPHARRPRPRLPRHPGPLRLARPLSRHSAPARTRT
jgi:beta-keto acid cleavage enzyme